MPKITPPKFSHIGRVVTHDDWPRFTITFVPQADKSLLARGAVWVDDPPTDATIIARLMREAGDYYAKHRLDDWVQRACVVRADRLGLTAYAIAKATGGAVSDDHVKDFLAGRHSMGSHKLQHVLRVLGLELKVGDQERA